MDWIRWPDAETVTVTAATLLGPIMRQQDPLRKDNWEVCICAPVCLIINFRYYDVFITEYLYWDMDCRDCCGPTVYVFDGGHVYTSSVTCKADPVHQQGLLSTLTYEMCGVRDLETRRFTVSGCVTL